MLNAADFFVDPDIKKARTLPREAYLSGEFQEVELEAIFKRMWMPVPQRSAAELKGNPKSLHELLRRPGAYVPFDMLGNPLLLQRDTEDQTLRCFSNVCTHAWYQLEQGCGELTRRNRFHFCGQHGRQFDSKGKCISQPGFSGKMEKFPSDDDHLPEIKLAEWEQFLFLCLGEPKVLFGEIFDPIRKSLGNLNVKDFKRYPRDNEEAEVDGNWKFHVNNYMDLLHIGVLHGLPKGLAETLDMPSYKFEYPHPFCSLQWAYAKNPKDGFEPGILPKRFHDPAHPEKRVYALWWCVLPNMDINVYKWGMSLNVFFPIVNEPQKSLWRGYHYVRDEEEYVRLNAKLLNLNVSTEDFDAISRVAHGANSGFAKRGRFGPSEGGPHWLQTFVYSMMFEN